MSTDKDNNELALSKAERGRALAGNLDALSVQLAEAWMMEGNFARTIAYGMAVAELRDALNDKVMAALVKLKNTKFGFRTDEGPKVGVYGVDVVRDAVIEAATLGLQCVGNHFNILGGNMYVTKEGFTFLLRQLSAAGRLQGMKFIYHPAEIKESCTQGVGRNGELYQKVEREALVKVDVSCVWEGKPVVECLEFVIRVNAGMSHDAVLGKAERKAKAWLYNYLTDQAIGDGSADADELLWRDKEADAADVVEVGAEKPMRKVAPVAGAAAGAPAAFKPNFLRAAEEQKDDVKADMGELPGLPVIGELK